MHLLFLGFSSIVQRRVLPAAQAVWSIGEISIASRSRPAPPAWPKSGRFFSDYHAALRNSGADIVYVSLPNSMHDEWVMAALAAGKHVVVDKPAVMTLEGAERVIEQARGAHRLVAEATVFSYHPQFDKLKAFVAEYGPLRLVDAHFMIPPLPIANFRNYAELGGGCLLDMGSYAASTMRIFGGKSPSQIITALGAGRHPETGVDMGFSVQARLANGAIFAGHFSLEGEYQNRMLIVGRSGSVMIERVFSPPADLKIEWRLRVRNHESVLTLEPADTFAQFLESAVRAAVAGEYDQLHRDLLSDARCRSAIADAIATASQPFA
jgi:NDP-hexose-3-ketoreductase